MNNEKIDIAEFWIQLVGKLLICEHENGKIFSSKLVSVDGDSLWFRDSKGRLVLNNRSKLISVCEYNPKVV